MKLLIKNRCRNWQICAFLGTWQQVRRSHMGRYYWEGPPSTVPLSRNVCSKRRSWVSAAIFRPIVMPMAVVKFKYTLCVHTCRQQDLFRILKAYTLLRPEEGYCQAQAPIAAVLLMHMPAEVNTNIRQSTFLDFISIKWKNVVNIGYSLLWWYSKEE